MAQASSSTLTHLECPECGQVFDADQVQTCCQSCRSPILARYDLEGLRSRLTPAEVQHRGRGVWRWTELLPVRDARYRFSLGEGDTPLLAVPRLGKKLGVASLFVKDESLNPTASFKARGLAVAVSRAVELGLSNFVIPTAGNAGGALAAYARRAGADAHIYMPSDAPAINQAEVSAVGCDLHLVDGLISDAALLAVRSASENNWFDMSTFKEPYRVEGKKTMGFELAEAFEWDMPDVIVYPTGGGTGLAGMWKAFAELEVLGWIGAKRPRMVSVQAEGCAPIVKAFQQNAPRAEFWKDAHTLAGGLRVPGVFADRLILRALRESLGIAIAVSDPDILDAQTELAQTEGIFACPEGAATLAGLHSLLELGWLDPTERVVLYNTGSGIKYR